MQQNTTYNNSISLYLEYTSIYYGVLCLSNFSFLTIRNESDVNLLFHILNENKKEKNKKKPYL